MDTNFIIFEHKYSSLINFSEVLETSIDTLRISSLGNTFVKFVGSIPPSIDGIPNHSVLYTYEEMLIILSEPEWNNTL
jgi:hypothetical protein